LIGVLISLLILAVVLWVAALILDMVIPSSGLPPQIKPIVLAIIGLIGIVSILGGYRLNL
jgi:uncharacterized membrane-anchored protein